MPSSLNVSQLLPNDVRQDINTWDACGMHMQIVESVKNFQW